MIEVLGAGLAHGLALCGFMTAFVGVTLWHDPRIWQRSAPADVKAMLGPMPPESRARRRAWGLVMVAGLVAIFGSLAARIDGFWPTAAAAYLAFGAFNLFDAVVIDLGLVVLRPRWAFVPGTEDAPGLRDPRWHLRNWLVGVVVGVPFALAVAAAGTGVRWLVGPAAATVICPMAMQAENPRCPADPCAARCGTEAELRACCVEAHGLPLDEAGALCVAQVAGLPVGISGCGARMDGPDVWVVTNAMSPTEGLTVRVRAADGAVVGTGGVTYRTMSMP